ncbi:hypothetical protein BN1221_03054 [Brenneria goodwinii]|uniref:Uncharacterized protein n=1 Tax=Brenneria goodwinii TaxID=1109412 RepID=A0A0G4JXE9_9GAMM|nr:hypothetical protein BN1221_03054 [Brenneria goodwinii]
MSASTLKIGRITLGYQQGSDFEGVEHITTLWRGKRLRRLEKRIMR